MIEQSKLFSWDPDADENNPSQLTDSDQVFPISKGIKSFSIPVRRALTAKIVFKDPVTTSNITALNEYYPPAVQSYTSYWSDGTSTLYVLTEKVRAAYFASSQLVGTAATNGAIFSLTDGVFDLRAYVNSGDSSARPNEPATVPSGTSDKNQPVFGGSAAAFDLTFDLSRQDFGSFAQYGDYCFVATGDNLVYFTSSSKIIPDQRLSVDSVNAVAKYVAQAGDFLFLANSTSGSNDDKGVIRDSMYWICSAIGVTDSNGSPDFNLTNSAANRSESSRVADTPGPIVGMKALDRAIIIYKERATYMISDDGSGMVQQTLSTEVGALCENSVVDLGSRHVFVGHGDFYFVEGQAVQPLPNPCKEFLLGPNGDLDSTRYFGVRSSHNKEQTCVYWYYPSVEYRSYQLDSDEFKPVCDKWVCWNYSTDAWTRGTGVQVDSTANRKVSVGAVCSPDLDSANATTYLGFGTTANALFSSAPDWNTDIQYAWVSFLISGFTNRHAAVFGVLTRYADTSGDGTTVVDSPLHALDGSRYETGEGGWPAGTITAGGYAHPKLLLPEVASIYQNNLISDPDQPTSGVVSVVRSGDFGDGINFKFVRGIRPRFVGNVTPSSVTCTIYVRQQLSDDWKDSGSSYAGQGDLNASSPFWFSIRSNSRYHQFEFTFTGTAELSGYDIDYDDSGTR